uniref:EIF3g domain-containing protein n=1 Tax=Heterorhabditis bacteriophora TaxID=37862 RepID=A0A1I7XD11_HETBA
MTVGTMSNTNILSSAPEVGSWAEAVEQDNLPSNEVNEDGVKTIIDYVDEDAGRFKVKATSREHCRHCKGNDHWSTNCPYKVRLHR